MSQDIRSFFKVSSSTKSQLNGSSNVLNKSKKRPVVIESSDEDIIPNTPEVKTVEKPVKKRKKGLTNHDFKAKSKTDETPKKESKILIPIDVLSTFGDTPVKQTPVLKKPSTLTNLPKQTTKTKNKKSKKQLKTEIGIHNDKNFEKSLLDLDEDFLISNVDELDKSINNALQLCKAEEPQTSIEDHLVEFPNSSTPKTAKPEKKVEHYDGDNDQERYEKKRHSAILYKKYLNRSGPAHHGCKEIPKGKPNCLQNLCFIRTGVLDSLENEEFESLIKDHGGRTVNSISKKVNYVVVGDDPGPAKLAKAESYGIKQISEDELLDLIREKSDMDSINEDNSVLVQSIPQIKNEDEKFSQKKMKPKEKTSQSYEKPLHSTKEDDKNDIFSSATTSKASKEKASMSTKKNDRKTIPPPAIEPNILNKDHLPWTEKYKPKSVKFIIGQQTDKSNVNKLMFWLEKWFDNHSGANKPKLIRPNPWAKNDDGAYYKAALLSGPPGIGKTTTATLVANELGFDVVEFNASDTRSKKLLHEEVAQLLSTKSLAGYFSCGSAPSKQHVLLMDEVDGMAGNEDRGGVQELISLIKNSSIPVICMCNDRNHPKIRSLSNYCFDLRFARPRLEQIKGAMMSVCFKEGVKINPESLNEIITSSGMDIRQILTHLSLWTAEKNNDTTENIKAPKKDSPLGPWEVCRKVFSAQEQKTSSIADRERLFYHDYSLAPLFVQENYLKVMPHHSKNEHLKMFAATASSISMGDIVDSKIRQSNNWSLLNVEAMCLSVLPGAYLSGHVNAQIDFPSWLGKNSKKNKFTRLLSELQAHMRKSISGNRSEVNLDYITHLRRSIVQPLIKRGGEGVEEALSVMHAYSLLREDLDGILELAHWPTQKDPMSLVDSKVKAAFTRSYNKISAKLPYAIQSNITKKKGTLSTQDEYGLSDEDEDISETDEKNISTDAMIKAKKPSKKVNRKDEPSTSGNKRVAKGGMNKTNAKKPRK